MTKWDSVATEIDAEQMKVWRRAIHRSPEGKTAAIAAPNHNRAFDFDKAAMPAGAKALAAMTLEFMMKP